MDRLDKGVKPCHTQKKRSVIKRLTQARPLLTIRDRVLQLLQKVPQALTTEDISELLNIPYGSVQPRLSELKNDGKIQDTGERGETRWGKACIKWRAL
jgi:predicted transcriptional regulator